MSERIYIFKGFERFWHWAQAALIITLLLTGFEIHGSYKLFGFYKALDTHTTAAWALIGLWVFAIFWHVTTGEWRRGGASANVHFRHHRSNPVEFVRELQLRGALRAGLRAGAEGERRVQFRPGGHDERRLLRGHPHGDRAARRNFGTGAEIPAPRPAGAAPWPPRR